MTARTPTIILSEELPDPTLLQLIAASALITTIEAQCAAGIHSEQEEMRLRLLTTRACRAFAIDSPAERANYDNVLSIVDREMSA